MPTQTANTRITILVDNHVEKPNLRAEHGWACWIQTATSNILFDTGQSNLIIQNATALNIPLNKTHAIVLSHGHYDHTGGLAPIRQMAPHAQIYTHPAALQPKFAKSPGRPTRNVGIPEDARLAAIQHPSLLTQTNAPTRIAPGAFATGPIPRHNDYENTGGNFFTDPQSQCTDNIPDDQALILKTHPATTVILGCAHAGLINTLNYVKRCTDNKPIGLVIGGTHLVTASPQRLQQTTAALHQFNLDNLVTCHCTGLNAIAHLKIALGQRCQPGTVGAQFNVTLAADGFSPTP